MFSIAICDDDKTICAQIENAILNNLQDFDDKIEIEVYNSACELFAQMKKGEKYSLVFLDIEIPDMTGIELSNNIRNYMDDFNTQIVFISGSEMYYRQLFDVQPLHFIIKPIDESVLIKDVKLALKLCAKKEMNFVYSIAKTQYKLPVEDIMYVESEGRKIILTTHDDCVKFYSTMDDVQKKLKAKHFMRIHRAFIVNYNFVKKMNYDYIEMIDGKEFAVGRLFKKSLKDNILLIEKELMQ